MKLLLECEGVDIDASNVDGRTPLHFAVVYGHAVVAGTYILLIYAITPIPPVALPV